MYVESYSTHHSTPIIHQADEAHSFKQHYYALLNYCGEHATKEAALHFLTSQLALTQHLDLDLPPDEQGLLQWLADQTEQIGRQYQAYLQERRQGEPRRYFTNRAHALFFLKAIAPTKMVDGAWLYGFTKYYKNERFSGLIDTYLQELGEGAQEKNHVALYKKLLKKYGLSISPDLKDHYYQQGAIQLALGHLTEYFLPEVIGFNLGYEQPPLHLLITAYELKELDVDPHYFNLHVTIDNADTGHAKTAVYSVLENVPLLGDKEAYFARIARGYQLNQLGMSAEAIIRDFDIEQEFLSILQHKAEIGHRMHSDHGKIDGRTINAWLSDPERIPQFITALENNGWLQRNSDPVKSRFWKLIDDDHAKMFGVFSPYEKQVIYDWIAGSFNTRATGKRSPQKVNDHLHGNHTADGYGLPPMIPTPYKFTTNIIPLHAAQSREQKPILVQPKTLQDEDIALFEHAMRSCDNKLARMQLLTTWMAPANHHSSVGLRATQLYLAELFNAESRYSS